MNFQGTQRFLPRLELFASVVMGLKVVPAQAHGQSLALTCSVPLGNHTHE